MSNLGPYRLLKRLATGGMGEIYLANLEREAGFEKVVVIKKILPNFSDDPAFVKMFNREARIAAKLGHQNIVQIFDFGQVAGSYFIAMEFVHGRDLRTLLAATEAMQQSVPPAVAVQIIAQVASGLDYAHRRRDDAKGNKLGIVHRDVSPQNILVSYEGAIKLTDFGLASSREAHESEGGQIQGKFMYMSPEQTFGAELDLRSDIFSLGIIAYELFTGSRPFDGDSVHELITAIRACDYEPPSSRNSNLPEALDHALVGALSRDVEGRYDDVRSFARALSDVAREHGWLAGTGEVSQWVHEVCPEEAAVVSGSGPGTVVSAQPIAGINPFERTQVADSAIAGQKKSSTAPAMKRISDDDLSKTRLGTATTAPAMRRVTITPDRDQEDAATAEVAPYRPDSADGADNTPAKTPRWLVIAVPVLLLVVLGAGAVAVMSAMSTDTSGNDAGSDGTDVGVVATTEDAEQQEETENPNLILVVSPPDATVSIAGEPVAATSEQSGRYELTQEPGPLEVVVSHKQHIEEKLSLEVSDDRPLTKVVQLRMLPVTVKLVADREFAVTATVKTDTFASQCARVPCVVQVPGGGDVTVEASIDGIAKKFSETRPTEPGKTVEFKLPTPVVVVKSEPTFRASLSRTVDGERKSRPVVGANLNSRPKGSGKATIDDLSVALRYTWNNGQLKVNVACDPFCAIKYPGGQTDRPLVGHTVQPGNHSYLLTNRSAVLRLYYKAE